LNSTLRARALSYHKNSQQPVRFVPWPPSRATQVRFLPGAAKGQIFASRVLTKMKSDSVHCCSSFAKRSSGLYT
jgi:hypothetical protein